MLERLESLGRRAARLAGAALVVAAAACGGRTASPAPASADGWVGTWGASPQLVEPRNMPPQPGLSGATLRQVVQVSVGGDRVRLRLSNEFGDGPVEVREARLAVPASGSAIDAATDRGVTFGGGASVAIPPGRAVMSDPLPWSLAPLSRVAITLRLGAVPGDVTGHPGSRTTSYLARGDAASSDSLPGAAETEHWYLVTGIDVVAPNARAVVVLGNSITDGRGSGTNRQNRWPDVLARRLLGDARTNRVAVLNQGIGGNRVLHGGGLGPPALDRFDRDVLSQAGARWLVVLEGVNDIGGANGAAGSDSVARGLIDAYRWMIDRAHARGMRVYGATILPFGGSMYDAPGHEAARQRVNRWIRTGGAFDAVIDLDAAVRDPAHPERMRAELDTGDHLHPGEAGHRAMGEAVDLSLFAAR